MLSPPQPPILTAGPYLVIPETEVTEVKCISRGGKPPASLVWRLNGLPLTSGVEERIEMISESKRSMTVSSVMLTGVRNMTGSVLECEVSGQENMRVSSEIVIEHPPEVRLELESGEAEVREADTIKVFCSAVASPDLVEYQWHLAGEEVVEARGATELVLTATRRLHNKRVTCLARNKVGQNSADLVLDIKCELRPGPRGPDCHLIYSKTG